MNYNERLVLTENATNLFDSIKTTKSENFFALAALVSAQETPNVLREIDFIEVDGKVVAKYLKLDKDGSKPGDFQTMKVGKILKYLADVYENTGCYEIFDITEEEKFTDKDIEELTHKITSALLQENLIFEIVSGMDIPKYYHENQYIDKCGSTLGSSCMRHAKINHLMDFYALIPQCHLVILKDTLVNPNKIVARTLLWETPEGSFMDRRYYHNETYEQALVQFAKKKGFYYKARNSADSSESCRFIAPDGKQVDKRLMFKLPKVKIESLPYADTLFNYYPELGILTNKSVSATINFSSRHVRNQSDEKLALISLLDFTGENPYGFTCSKCGKKVEVLDKFVQGIGFLCNSCHHE